MTELGWTEAVLDAEVTLVSRKGEAMAFVSRTRFIWGERGACIGSYVMGDIQEIRTRPEIKS